MTRWLHTTPFRTRVPYARQLASADCGAACLAMVLKFYGRTVSVADLQTSLGGSRDGTNTARLAAAARKFGLQPSEATATAATLAQLPIGAILHWDDAHFVVFDGCAGRRARILDPAVGRLRMPLSEAATHLTGTALILIPAPAFEPGVSPAPRRAGFTAYVRQVLAEWPLLVRALLLSLTAMGLSMAPPLLTRVLVDEVLVTGEVALLTVVLYAILAIPLIQVATAWVRELVLLEARTSLDRTMTTSFVSHLISLPFPFFQSRSRGDLLMRLSSHASIREVLTGGLLSMMSDGLFVVSHLLLMTFLDARMAAVVGVLAAAQVLVLLLTVGPQRQRVNECVALQSRCNSIQIELLSHMEVLKAMGRHGAAFESWARLMSVMLDGNYRRGRLAAVVEAALSSVRVTAPAVLIWFGTVEVLREQLSIGTMLALVSLGLSFLRPLGAIVDTTLRCAALSSYIDRLSDVACSAPERAGGRRLEPFAGEITVKNLGFRYDLAGPPILKNLSFSVRPGQFVAIVGPTGGGKSTLARLLLGLQTPSEGAVLYDGMPLGEIDLSWLRRHIGFVGQDPQLFGTTILSNITFNDAAIPFDAVERAARTAQLHDEVLRMPMRYQTLIGDGGQSLSGGQRQRLALARALVHQPAMLILDEATSSLDARTERAIQDSLSELRCTRIVIAHRLSTIAGADLILVLHKGEIVETGRHHALMNDERIYGQLVRAQVQVEPDGRSELLM